MRIVFFGTYMNTDAYPVNLVLLRGLRAASCELVECREDLWQGFLHRALGRGASAWVRLALRALGRYAKLVWRYGHCGHHEVVVVGYPGYIDIVIARLLNIYSRRLLVLVSFLSLYDTAVLDRGQGEKGSLRARLFYAIDRLAFRSADWVLVDTDALASYYAELFKLPLSKFRKSLVGNVFDVYEPSVLRRPNGHFRVLFFGTYVPLQGAEFIVAAAELLRGEEVEFEMVGSGQDYEAVRRRAEESQLKKVHFADEWYSVDQLAESMRRADVCLGIFGTTPKAGRVIPYKVFGALALRRPVITRDSPAIRELLVDGESALLCSAGDGGGLAESIERLRCNPELAAHVAQGGYDSYRQYASAEAIGRDLHQALENASVA
ncbi:MAG: glycosyltransferase involved in cell wall biosynthesis [Candidatus Latescibacterota bacterium]|jgi:glycosyltransferase involved in cell wall biosynthesis